MILDPDLTEEEWQVERFSEEELAAAKHAHAAVGGREVTMKQLKAALDKYGPDGVLDAGIMLPRKQFEDLEKLVKAAGKRKR